MRRTYKNTFLAALFLVFNCSLIYTQEMEFNRVIPEDGTNFGRVNEITQDKDGFMWFATMKGLYRYDGNQLTHFVNDTSHINSIASNRIRTIYADSNGILWISCLGSGLDRYDPETGIFNHFRHDPNDVTSIASDIIFDILRDHEGKLWIGTGQGVDQFDPETNSFIHFKSKKDDTTSLSDLKVNCLYEDKQGTLWIGTGNPWESQGNNDPEYGGLNRYNRATGTFTQYKHQNNDPHSLSSNKISSIFEDNNGVLWIGTFNNDNGLHQMDRKKGTFKQTMYNPAHPKAFGNPKNQNIRNLETVYFLSQDTTGGYWIGKMRSGLFYFNPAIGEMLQFRGPKAETSGFMDATGITAYTSRDGVLWIGGENVYRANILHQKISKPFVSAERVESLYEEPDGTFWIGKENDLLRVDKKTGDTTKFNTVFKSEKVTSTAFYFIDTDLQGTLWVGTSNGLFKWDAAKQSFKGYQPDPKNENSLSDNDVFAICEDSQHKFWIGTKNGLNLMDRKTGEFTHFNEFGDSYISTIIEDKSGYVWISGWLSGAGLARFNPNTELFKTYGGRSFSPFIYEDSDSVVWAGSQNGFYFFNPDMDEFIPFNNAYALSGLSDISGMVEDNLKNLWIVTREAIVRLNQERTHTSVYGENYGIKRGSLFYGTPLKGKNGDIYIGHETGYFQINPLDFPKNADPGEILFSQFLLFDEEIKQSKAGPLKQPLQKTSSIKLPYNKNVFSIDFTLFDYRHPEDVRLLYYLENHDNDWIPAYSKRRASYFNVPPGNYVFRVKGANSNGIWVEKEIELIILPPWYRTWLAYGFYALFFIVAVFTFDRFMRRRIIRKERQKTQERELAQAKEIEKAYTELKATQAQLIQSEKMASLGELTAGIAHEIQNPLNFVNNFSEVSSELVDEMDEEMEKGDLEEAREIAKDIKQNLEKINHHGKRADAIVKGMLQHSRSSSGQKELTDINALADEYLRLSYHGLRAKDKSFNADFKLEADEKLPKVNIVAADMGRVLLNLVNNAFYAVSEKAKKEDSDYKPSVEIFTKTLGNKVEIKVSDNGNGIPTEIKEKIFQPFYTTKPTGEGTGLGLSLSYDIVKAHGGEIKVVSTEKEGTEFIITIPIPS